jgi:hypothetical protein
VTLAQVRTLCFWVSKFLRLSSSMIAEQKLSLMLSSMSSLLTLVFMTMRVSAVMPMIFTRCHIKAVSSVDSLFRFAVHCDKMKP